MAQPLVKTGDATAIRRTSAVLSGMLEALDSAQGYTVGISYAEESVLAGLNFGTRAYGKLPGPFSFSIENLKPGTLYYYRAYAYFPGGYVYGAEKTFTTVQEVLKLPVCFRRYYGWQSTGRHTFVYHPWKAEQFGAYPKTAARVLLLPDPNATVAYYTTSLPIAGRDGNAVSLLDSTHIVLKTDPFLKPGSVYYVQLVAWTADGWGSSDIVRVITRLPEAPAFRMLFQDSLRYQAHPSLPAVVRGARIGFACIPGNYVVAEGGYVMNTTGVPTLSDIVLLRKSYLPAELAFLFPAVAAPVTYHIRAFVQMSHGGIQYGPEVICRAPAFPAPVSFATQDGRLWISIPSLS